MNLPASASTPVPRQVIDRERGALLRQLDRALEVPMVVLGFAWLALLIVELTAGLSRALEVAGTVIWMLFITDFALKFSIAPRKLRFLRQQWLTALSLALPALRFCASCGWRACSGWREPRAGCGSCASSRRSTAACARSGRAWAGAGSATCSRSLPW